MTILPSEKAPATAHFWEDLVEETFPEHEVAVLPGGADAARAALALPWDHVFFTGSTRVGKIVAEAAAKHLTPVTLELGGKCPAIVDRSADVASAARAIGWAKFVNSGQTCIAPDYVLVDESRERELIDELKKYLTSAYGPAEADRLRTPDACRIINVAAFDAIEKLFTDAVAAGAAVESGGTFDRATRRMTPTIVRDVPAGDVILEREIFGPILPIVPFRALADALAFVRARTRPLAVYAFSERAEIVEEILRNTTAGGTVVGGALVHYANPHLPFGGVGESGAGRYHGEAGFRELSNQRSVLYQGRFSAVRWLTPPYTPNKSMIVRLVTEWLARK